MKKVFVLLGSMCLFFCVCFALPEAKSAITKNKNPLKQANPSVTFNGKKFYLQYSVGTQQEWLNEYLPDGQNFDNYTEMIAVRSYDAIKATPQDIAQIIAHNYAQKHPGVKYLLAANKKTGDGLVSFIEIGDHILEFNLFRTTTKDLIPVSIQYVYRKIFPRERLAPGKTCPPLGRKPLNVETDG